MKTTILTAIAALLIGLSSLAQNDVQTNPPEIAKSMWDLYQIDVVDGIIKQSQSFASGDASLVFLSEGSDTFISTIIHDNLDLMTAHLKDVLVDWNKNESSGMKGWSKVYRSSGGAWVNIMIFNNSDLVLKVQQDDQSVTYYGDFNSYVGSR